MEVKVNVGQSGHGQRVDAFLPSCLARFSRTRIRALVDAGAVLVDGRAVKPGRRLRSGERVVVTWDEADKPDLVRDSVPLEVLHEDGWVLAVNKPAGMPVQPRHRFEGGSLVNAVLGHLGLAGDRGPGVLHRLDRDTSGVVLVAKTDEARGFLGQQFERRKVEKEYVALVHGVPDPPEGEVELPLGVDPQDRLRMVVGGLDPRPALTRYRVVEPLAGGSHAWVALWPRTGRTHQLRVHLAAIGHPILADDFYAPRKGPEVTLRRQALHARRIAFRHPEDGRPFAVLAPLPADLLVEAERLGSRIAEAGGSS